MLKLEMPGKLGWRGLKVGVDWVQAQEAALDGRRGKSVLVSNEMKRNSRTRK
jgi:hypothetical protein